MPTTSKNALRYPASTAAPNVPQDIQNLASDLDNKVLREFANISARNAAFPSPTKGDKCTVNGLLHVHNGSKWKFANEGDGIVTTDAGGNIVVSHGLGATPIGVLVSSAPQASDLLNRVININWVNADATNFVLYVKRDDTNAALGSTLTAFSWRAYL